MTIFDVIIVANGTSSRMGFDKLSARLGEETVLSRTVSCFQNLQGLQKIILVSDRFSEFDGCVCVGGGSTRTQSVRCGLEKVTSPFVLIHDGARPFVEKKLLDRILATLAEKGSAVPFIRPTDSMRRILNGVAETVDRNDYVLLQTPQAFRTEDIRKAYDLSRTDETDDSALYAEFIAPPALVEGDYANKKITRPEDLFGINAKIGTGFDVHKLVEGRPLRLGGITVPFEKGEEAHSDGDVLLHALMDALLTAAALPDIGTLFPDTDEKYRNIDSTLLLQDVYGRLAEKHLTVLSCDTAVLLQRPKIAPYLPQMRQNIASVLHIAPEKVNISATTTETLGIIGEGNGIAALAVVSLS